MKHICLLLLCISIQITNAQETKNGLFLGNSYTYFNNLPNLIAQAATSTGDVFTHESNTPGGYTLMGHTTSTTSLNKIKLGNWDYVILQDQSQRPSFPDAQVAADVYPYAQRLNDSIVKYNPCAETTFYMTWGRENGDAANCGSWPAVCTYEGMDDLLRQRYQTMANDNDGIASPVGAVWRYLRTNHPTIDLYASDGSHPSLTGSYAAAITFYCALFRKDPTFVSFNSSLNAADATIIKNAVKTIVFDDFTEWNIGNYDPISDFLYTNINEDFTFTNNSTNGVSYTWNFGDGNTATDENPTHSYTAIGDYTVTHTVTKCGKTASYSDTITVTSLSVSEETINSEFSILNNPSENNLQIESSKFNQQHYQILVYTILGQKVIETESIKNDKQTININSLQSGMYLLQIIENNKVIHAEKFIKK